MLHLLRKFIKIMVKLITHEHIHIEKTLTHEILINGSCINIVETYKIINKVFSGILIYSKYTYMT